MKKLKRKKTSVKSSQSEVENESKVSLKLLVDTKSNKVLFAEAGKDFVDFLFHIMSLPVGTVIKLLNEKGMVGCLGSLYKSIESLNDDYLQPNLDKEAVLKAKTAVDDAPLLLMNTPTTTSSGGSGSGGYVKGVVTYMVMDDLEVTPMSTISGITLISKFHVKDVNALEEKVVRVGLDEGLGMLKASLETNTVLTTVFLN